MKAAVLYLCEGARIVEAASQACKPWDFSLVVFLEVMSSHKLYYTTKISCHVQIDIKKKIEVFWRELVPLPCIF